MLVGDGIYPSREPCSNRQVLRSGQDRSLQTVRKSIVGRGLDPSGKVCGSGNAPGRDKSLPYDFSYAPASGSSSTAAR